MGPDPDDPATYAALFGAFNARFGLQTSGEFLSLNPAKPRPRLVIEAGNNSVSADIVTGDAVDGALMMLQAGVVKPYPYQDVFGSEILDLPKAQIGVPEL